MHEHTSLSAKPAHATVYATGLVDLDPRIMIDLFEGQAPPSCADGRRAKRRAGAGGSGWWRWI